MWNEQDYVEVDFFEDDLFVDDICFADEDSFPVEIGEIQHSGMADFVEWKNVLNKPTTVAGYGITDAQEKITDNNKLPVDLIDGLADVAKSGDFDDLINKPTIPTKVSDLQNDMNYQTAQQVQDAVDVKQDVISDLDEIRQGAEDGSEALSKALNPITKTEEMTQEVGKDASGRLYTIPSRGDVTSVNGQTGDVVLDAEDVGALPDDTIIPTDLSQLTQDSTHRLVTDTEKSTWNDKQDAILPNTYDVYGSAAAVQDNLDAEITDRQNADATINSKIPTQASAQNQLADKDFVNSSISTNTAYFRGTYNVVDDLGLTYDATEQQIAVALATKITEKTNNDYVFVFFVNPTTQETEKYERFKYVSNTNVWTYEFSLNNSTFTAEQWSAITSGITANDVSQITTNKNAIANKVDKVDGKQLSTNDFTNADKQKLDSAITSLDGYATEEYVDNHHDNTKQNVISDLTQIRNGASLGSTAVQPSQLSDVAISGSYNDLTDTPTIPSLDGYATEEWVEDKGYQTEQDVQDAISSKEDKGKLTINNVQKNVSTHILSWTNDGVTYSYEVVTV